MAALLTRNRADGVEGAIERLVALDGEALRGEWRNLFGKRAPKTLPKSLLVRALAYRMQALEFGDLDPQMLRVLEAYAAKGAGRGRSGSRTKQGSISPGFKPGSILVREWASELHRVMVLEVGFAWNGATYGSLSQVARAITGTRWNGPRFFGLGRETETKKDAGDGAAVANRGVSPRPHRRVGPDATPSRRPATGCGPKDVAP